MLVFSEQKDSNLDIGRRNLLPLTLLFAGLTTIGLAFALHAMIVGHDHVFGTSREVPWGILITPYVFFACLATGICIISSFGQVFRSKTFAPLVNRTVYLAIIAIVSGLMSIGLEIENPWRMALYGILSPNPLSNIWWKSSIYTLFLVLTILNFLNLVFNRPTLARGFATAALIAVTCGNLNMNSDMALLGARGFWAENYMPLFFMIVSTLSACCVVVVSIWLSSLLHGRPVDNDTRSAIATLYKLTIVLLVGLLSFGFVKLLGGFSNTFTENPEAMHLLVRGDFALNFWGGELLLAGLLPLVLLFASRGGERIAVFALAGISALAGIAITIYDLIIVGQLIPHFHQYHLVDMPQYYSYSPSLHEYMMVLGAVSFFATAFLIGEISFNSKES